MLDNSQQCSGLKTNDIQALLADQEALKGVLLLHVVPSLIKAGDIPAGSTAVTTAGGEDIIVANDGGDVTVNGATVIATDVLASNGVIHLVDTVIAPTQNIAQLALTTYYTLRDRP